MKVSEMFPKKYATGEDLNGRAYTLTIARITQEEMRPQPGAPPQKKWVLYFREARKGVILSRTLAYQIAEAVGSEETNDWIGKPITIYPEPLIVAGQKRIAIRARKANGGTPEPPPTLAEEEDEDEEWAGA